MCVKNYLDVLNNIIKKLTQCKNQRRYFKTPLVLNKDTALLNYWTLVNGWSVFFKCHGNGT